MAGQQDGWEPLIYVLSETDMEGIKLSEFVHLHRHEAYLWRYIHS